MASIPGAFKGPFAPGADCEIGSGKAISRLERRAGLTPTVGGPSDGRLGLATDGSGYRCLVIWLRVEVADAVEEFVEVAHRIEEPADRIETVVDGLEKVDLAFGGGALIEALVAKRSGVIEHRLAIRMRDVADLMPETLGVGLDDPNKAAHLRPNLGRTLGIPWETGACGTVGTATVSRDAREMLAGPESRDRKSVV